MKNIIIKNILFIGASLLGYSLSYFPMYGIVLSPWGSVFNGDNANWKCFVFLGILPSYVALLMLRNSYKASGKIDIVSILASLFISFFIVGVANGVVLSVSSHSEFALFYILPSSIYNFFFVFFIIKWIKSWEGKVLSVL